MSLCVVYPSGKLGDLVWHIPFFKYLSKLSSCKIILITRKSNGAHILLSEEGCIKKVFYNEFKKNSLNYFLEIYYMYSILKKEKIKEMWILDKISRPAISAKLAGLKKIIGYGAGAQKLWITNAIYLSKTDYNLQYIERGIKFFNLIGCNFSYEEPKIKIKNQLIKNAKKLLNINNKKKLILYGVDSGELWKVWPAEYFIELINKINNNSPNIYNVLIASPKNKYIAEQIKKGVKNKKTQNLSDASIGELIGLLKIADLFIGNDSGPLNLSAAVGTRSIGIFGATRSLNHSKNIFSAISKKGEISKKTDLPLDAKGNAVKNVEFMKRVTVNDVFFKFKSIFKKI